MRQYKNKMPLTQLMQGFGQPSLTSTYTMEISVFAH